MKRFSSILLFVTTILSLTSCTGGDPDEAAAFIMYVSFIVAVIGAVTAYFTKDENRQIIAAIGAIVFLLTSLIILA